MSLRYVCCLQGPPFGRSVRRFRCLRQRKRKNRLWEKPASLGKNERLWQEPAPSGKTSSLGKKQRFQKKHRLRKNQQLRKKRRLRKKQRSLPIHSSNYLARLSPGSPQGTFRSSQE